ncbi:redox-regulated ATPase YchF [Thermosulfurimonas sp. F29]|uniref:redox-regulated ATPase YchF n=1 Tax=Thermosulfurimonas sp. F29 TaxID=2867247 RepID=UPI001C83B26E|nr:redox-regulated ATPase YchF [Thermosulfurimonas sp. F29]MBX6423585.1 redox-regulated ATPase YchF [Thermosulfurimonas sp. F29]
MTRLGIVGLPNAGKSTLFNALVRGARAEVAAYPFCTIEPNVGVVEVPDEGVRILAEREGAARAVPAVIEFVDIAGLVRNASRGEGLGNRFLAHIREMDALVMVLRCFEDESVSHVEGTVDPLRDLDILELELIAKDLETVERRWSRVEKPARSGDRDARRELEHLSLLREILERPEPLRRHRTGLPADLVAYAERTLFLLTLKPVLWVANIGEGDLPRGENNPLLRSLSRRAAGEGVPLVTLCAELEAQLAELPPEEAREMLSAYGLERPGLEILVEEGYRLLDLITFYTVNEKEARARTVPRGTTAVEAAAGIHTDMARGFIAAEVINLRDYLRVSGLAEARHRGLLRLEGRDYVLSNRDIVYIRFNI